MSPLRKDRLNLLYCHLLRLFDRCRRGINLSRPLGFYNSGFILALLQHS